jgi:uncharacterized protein YihD (DUF1040 family)
MCRFDSVFAHHQDCLECVLALFERNLDKDTEIKFLLSFLQQVAQLSSSLSDLTDITNSANESYLEILANVCF